MWNKLFLIGILFVLGLCGCSTQATENNLSGVHFVKSEEKVGGKTPEERAQSIKGNLRQIKGVSGNAVVVEGHTAIIGLRLEEGMEGEGARLSQAAKSAAHAADTDIESASVTINGRIVSLIEEMEHQRAN